MICRASKTWKLERKNMQRHPSKRGMEQSFRSMQIEKISLQSLQATTMYKVQKEIKQNKTKQNKTKQLP